MRKFISGLLAIAAAAFTGCYESGTDADNTSREARISISPAAIGFDADGRTTDGLAFGTYIVTVNPYGKMYSDWYAELVGTDWAINTSKLMAKAKLMDKIDGSVNQVLTREKAAQMTLNALKAPTVEYTTKGSSICLLYTSDAADEL